MITSIFLFAAVSVAPSGCSYTDHNSYYGQNLQISAPMVPIYMRDCTGGTAITSCALTSAIDLPAGLVLSQAYCTISGTPMIVSPSTTYSVTAGNNAGSTDASVSFSTGLLCDSLALLSSCPSMVQHNIIVLVFLEMRLESHVCCRKRILIMCSHTFTQGAYRVSSRVTRIS